MKKVMNYLRTGKHRIMAAVAVTVLLAAVSTCVSAAPQLKYMQGSGSAMFDVDGIEMFCQTAGAGEVHCITRDSSQFVCEYADAPVYFINCVKQ